MAKKIIAIVLGGLDAILLAVIIVSLVTGWRFGSPLFSSAAKDTSVFPTQAGTVSETVQPEDDEPEGLPTVPRAAVEIIEDVKDSAMSGFEWLTDALEGRFPADMKPLGKDEFIGRWKALFMFKDKKEIVYLTIDENAVITVEPSQIDNGDGWEDESSLSRYYFNGVFDIGGVSGAGEAGSISLYTFFSADKDQYGIGRYTDRSGEVASVGLTRP